MNTFTRRDFLSTSTAAGLSLLAGGRLSAADVKPRLRKAMILKAIDEPSLRELKDAGFDGVETTGIVEPAQALAGRALAEKIGLKIHGVSRGWAEFNSKDPSKVAASIDVTATAIRAAAAFGGNAVLLVPCRVSGMPMPEPWEFDITFDEKTGHVQKVVAGDNGKYVEYIAAHNYAIDSSREAVKKLIPIAEQTKIVIALENVWNNLWVKPALFRHFVASFNNPWVKAYFDIGNHVKYAPPTEWISTLGSLIFKCHVKDFQLNPDGHGGKFVPPREGSIDWPAVTKALAAIGYHDYLTIEDNALRLKGDKSRIDYKEYNRRLDLIIDGK